jgi:Carboxypeptidase regulatory-like domain
MPRLCVKLVVVALLTAFPSWGAAQGRTTGQIVGTVKDASGAVVPKADLILIDNGTGATVEAKSGADGNFVFPNLQPGRYQITATFQGFNPITIQEVIVETARSIDIVVQFEVAGVSEQVRVEGRTQVVETTSTTIASTVSNEEISKLPLAGRNILGFALLVPGAASSANARDSEYNGLPGGAINITLDGINNNSQRFRSGGTSFFTFAPVRLGAIEEVTVSTAGLAADAGAEGAVQVQFVTKRGSNAFHGSVFDQIQNEKLNAQGAVNKSRGIPKTRLRRHEWGANLGGPILQNKLFFFGNYEQVYQPGQTTVNRTVLKADSQRGIFRYLGTDNTERSVDLLAIARNNGLSSAIDPFVAAQIQTVNGSLGQGTLTSSPTNRLTDTFSFIVPQTPNVNVYPTGRVDYQAAQNLAMRGVLNLQYRNLPTNPRYPGQPSISDGFTSTYYILSTGADWTIKPNLFMGVSFGAQSNFEEFRPGNTLDIYSAQRGYRIDLPLMDEPEVFADQLPIPRNNPVWNITNTLTWLKGKHTFTFGGTFRRTTMYESIGGVPPSITVGMAGNDPATGVFTAANIPFLNTSDQGSAQALYALLTGRVSTSSGSYFLDEDTKEYGLNPAFRREAQNVGGFFVQDQWRVNPSLTVNYGLRWELTGAAHNTNGVYSGPDVADMFGPSTAPFQPGALNGTLNPQVYLKERPYTGDFNNAAPNLGVAWNPEKPSGFLGHLLGKAVYRANFGVNYYDEGLINFQTFAGNGPGISQSLTLPPFTPGSLNLQTPLPAYLRVPTEFAFPVAMSGFTFARGHATIDPDIRTPYVKNWTIGYQRELWSDAAIEVRYVGNRGSNLWRGYNINETNIFENGFLNDFRNAQRNLQINLAAGVSSFAHQGRPGQVPLPIFDAAFGPRGTQPAVAAGGGYGSSTFITQLRQGEAGRLANALASDFRYLCAMVGNGLPECNRRGYNTSGPYPINVFQMNPFAAGSAMRILTDESSSKYDSLQLQFRQRYRRGLSLTANYTYGKARTDRYPVSADNTADYVTLRDKSLNWAPTAYDLRHTFQAYGTVDLPFGKGRAVNIENAVLDQVLGGWSASTVLRIQTGRPFLLQSARQTFNQLDAGVILKGITVEDLQKMVNVRPGPNGNVFFFDEALIGSDGRSNPALLDYPTTPGELGQFVYLYGPGLWTADLGLAKTFSLPGGSRLNIESLFINAFNHRNVIVGGTGGATHSIDSTAFGQTTASAIGGREIQFRLGWMF